MILPIFVFDAITDRNKVFVGGGRGEGGGGGQAKLQNFIFFTTHFTSKSCSLETTEGKRVKLYIS